MKDYKEIIAELTVDQAKEVLSVAVESIKEHRREDNPIPTDENLPMDALDQLAKPILYALTEGEDEVAISLKRQLIENENFLQEQRSQGENRSISLSMLPLLTLAIAFIEAKFEIKIEGKDQKFHFAARIKSLQEVLPFFNSHKLDPIFSSEISAIPLSDSHQLKKEIIQLISQGKTSKAIDELMAHFENSDEATYEELIGISGRWEKINKEKRRGTIKQEDFQLESNKIDTALLDYVRSIK